MKKYCLVMPLLLSISAASAMTITKGKLISHQDYIPAGAKVSFKEIDIKIPEAMLKFRNNLANAPDYIDINVKMESGPREIEVGDNILIYGTSDVSISNFSNATHTYTVKTEICNAVPGTCYSTSDVVALESGGNFHIDRSPSATFVVDNWSYFTLSTSVQEDNQSRIFRSRDYVMVEPHEKDNLKK